MGRPTATKYQVGLQSEGQSKLTSEIPLSEQKTGNKGFENTLNEQKGAGQGKAGLQESDGGLDALVKSGVVQVGEMPKTKLQSAKEKLQSLKAKKNESKFKYGVRCSA